MKTRILIYTPSASGGYRHIYVLELRNGVHFRTMQDRPAIVRSHHFGFYSVLAYERGSKYKEATSYAFYLRQAQKLAEEWEAEISQSETQLTRT